MTLLLPMLAVLVGALVVRAVTASGAVALPGTALVGVSAAVLVGAAGIAGVAPTISAMRDQADTYAKLDDAGRYDLARGSAVGVDVDPGFIAVARREMQGHESFVALATSEPNRQWLKYRLLPHPALPARDVARADWVVYYGDVPWRGPEGLDPDDYYDVQYRAGVGLAKRKGAR